MSQTLNRIATLPLVPARPAIQESLDRALAGDRLSHAETHYLIEAADAELPAPCVAAVALRDRHKSRAVSYSRKVFIPLTTLCRDKCCYCTFVKSPDDPAARTLTPDEVLAIAEAGQRVNCKEACSASVSAPNCNMRWRAHTCGDWGTLPRSPTCAP
ncbi:MAG: hypothetical protein AAB342_05285 [Chloroflexota bacterium]